MQEFSSLDESNIIDSPPSWLARNKVPLIAGTLLVLAIAVGIVTWQTRRSFREDAANTEIEQALTVETKLSAARKFLGTEAAALALLNGASSLYEAKNYTGSEQTYALFLKTYPKHRFVNMARLGQAWALESLGKMDDALAAFVAVGTRNPIDNYNPVGLLEAARLYKAKQNIPSARQALNDCIRDYKNTLYGQQAAEELKSLPQS